ncbi:cob(I)yrinic acid a,c-diamide adenosyltransferase [Eisenibacter elegans]|jgi:cob(I)alamin adenosyltransferase|uniref:cob(I)yrinic acid a,c-diamide adenosyltransferase n=1 Tax=Eisenibacter elegans TaxID=997 RepID=UPI0003FF28BA|nr:cob(I)yrinic acid a,c-diamide adenosyltransferase [Eisenibacter elegans]
MKIYTKTGDSGQTSLIGGTRVSKAHIRIDAYGTVDELNSHIGLLGDQEVNAKRSTLIREIQDRLFTIGSSLAADPDKSALKLPDLREEDIQLLEEQIDEMQAQLPPLRSFILPGGHPAVSVGHIARCVCRRAERAVILLQQEAFVAPLVAQYLNRLSDYLFVLCRQMHQELGVDEIPWKPRK